VSINTDGSQADSSAILDVKSTTKGLLLPRMSFNERNSIVNPAEGLIIFCTDCGLNGMGVLSMFTGGEWFIFNLCKVSTPDPGDNLFYPSTIIWNWNPVPGASGYKWSSTNSFGSAIDLGPDTSRTETEIVCDTSYSRYVWAYDNCGFSIPLLMTQSTTNCWTCGQDLSINHTAGNAAPVTKSTTYGTVSNIPGESSKCWITKNLGSDHQATSVNDPSEASSGWYWQFNRLQGFKHDGTERTPNSSWENSIDEYSDWTTANDPCNSELGTGWRLPTSTEWTNVDASGNWSSWNDPWASLLKMHAAGRLDYSSGNIFDRGSKGAYWSCTQSGNTSMGQNMYFFTSSCGVNMFQKACGYSVRCVRD